MDIRVLLPWLAAQMLGVAGYKTLMARLPNSHHVSSPCDPALPWPGLGHLLPGGYGKRNQFGMDFKTHNLEWTEVMCRTDSDGDGRTNGEELGDPDCTWSPGNDVILDTSSVTHPGICEPMDTPECRRRNVWLSCDTNFTCPAVHQQDVQNMTFRFPEQQVPVKETTHVCMIVEFPQDGDYHIVATKPFLDNTKVMHHILLYGCNDEKEPAHAVNEPYECGMAFDPACRDILTLWLLGVPGECPHENAGFRIGTQGYRRGGIQLHWENQELSPSERDGSGMTIFYTSNTRMYDAGVLFIGQDFMAIPPGQPSHVETGTCYSDCTRRKMSENVYITAAVNHMHYLGKAMRIEHVRDNKTIHVITDEHNYEYDSPIMHSFQTPVEFRPGDELRSTCVFDSTPRDVTTLAGSGYQEEMCFGFLTFYPKQAIFNGDPSCTSWKTVPTCHFELDDEVEGCDFRNVHNRSHPDTKRVYDDVIKHCRPFGQCFKDCLVAVERAQQLPCYHGDIWDWQRNKILSNSTSNEDRLAWFQFYAAFDSCAELASSDDTHVMPSGTGSTYKTRYGTLAIIQLVFVALFARVL